MEAKEKLILREVISGMKLQFYIPVFQRNYSWQEKSCERLFNDIVELIEYKDKNHFVGSFVYKFAKFAQTQYNQFILIDGQQRMTSIILILKALRDYLSTFGNTYEDLILEIDESYLYNKFAKEQNLRLKLKPNKEDDENFNLLMENDLENIKKDSLIYINYKYFLSRIQNMSCSVEDFYDALQRIEGVAITLDEKDNPQLIFESLNSTGEDLTDVDLIRNYLLMNCNPENQNDLYKDYWLKLEGMLKNNFTNFIRDYLSFKNGAVVQNAKNKVYFAFRKYYQKEAINVEKFLENLLKYAEAYALLLKTTDRSDLSNKLEKTLTETIMLNMCTTYPFLMGILYDYKENKIDEENTIKIIRLIESYAVRRSICSIQGGALSQAMASLYKDLIEKYKDEFYIDTYIKVATKMASVNTNAYFPKNEQFKDEFIRRDMYASPLKKYILYKLESSNQSKEIINIDNLTIEHVMPRTLSEEWKKYLNMENVIEFHEQYKNRIGNLTLTAYNSEMSQKLFAEKKKHVDFSRLCLNKYFENIEYWNKNEIEIRGEELFKIAIQIWPFPDVVPEEELSSESYNILIDDEDDDFTNTKPIKYILNEKEKRVSSWAELYTNIIKELVNNNKEMVYSFIYDKDFNATTKMFSKDKEGLRTSAKISDDLYCETNLNTSRKIKILKEIFETLEIELTSLLVYIVPN